MENMTFDDFSNEEMTSIVLLTLDNDILEWEQGVVIKTETENRRIGETTISMLFSPVLTLSDSPVRVILSD